VFPERYRSTGVVPAIAGLVILAKTSPRENNIAFMIDSNYLTSLKSTINIRKICSALRQVYIILVTK
jgi:hypothetical protein